RMLQTIRNSRPLVSLTAFSAVPQIPATRAAIALKRVLLLRRRPRRHCSQQPQIRRPQRVLRQREPALLASALKVFFTVPLQRTLLRLRQEPWYLLTVLLWATNLTSSPYVKLKEMSSMASPFSL